jgi:hypothetical protein
MDLFPLVLYSVCVLTSAACTFFLFRAYVQSKARLLLWSTLCFVGLTVNNMFLFVDLIMLPSVDLRSLRLGAAMIGLLFLLYGFIWEAE